LVTLEWNDTCKTINLGVNGLGDDQLGKELLCLSSGEIQKLCESFATDARVILGDNSDILLLMIARF
jgi:hypothetical protein